MYFLALAADYDGTLAQEGTVPPSTIRALERLKESGRRLLLVTGRQLEDLLRVFPQAELFERVVAENGAVLYDPATRRERALGPSPPALFVTRLQERGVTPLSVGRSIVATWEPHEKTVLEAIRDLGLELQIVFNKGAVMVLPAGVNKATGLEAALAELELSSHNVVAVGDAENDHAFMSACGCAAAVQNALPLVKEAATIVLERDHGAGVEELVERMLADDGELIDRARHAIAVGRDRSGAEVAIEPHRGAVLIAGSSGIGKSTLATALTERMEERGFAFCVLDPEGDYDELANAVAVGDATTPPQPDEALKLLKAGTSVVVNTQNFNMSERPTFFAELLPRLAALRARGGRPHWLLIDEAHHLLPARREDLAALPENLPAAILITVHPEAVSAAALRTVRSVIALGDAALAVIEAFCAACDVPRPTLAVVPGPDEVLYWELDAGEPPRAVTPYGPEQTHKRHTRKYAEGDLGEERSFYFRGPDDRLRLRAQNLELFLQIAEGVDEGTWEHHRRRGDYSAWFRDVIKDPELADEAAAIEADDALGPRESRERIAEAVSRRYTAPATGGAV
ncbi:MAG TPA: HAD-IIB family hydrolase [Gammaproteobacteria bacterium]